MFEHRQNIADNKNLYFQNIAIKNEIISYMATGENIDGKKIKLSKFVHYIDKQLVKANNIAIGFDETKSPNYREVFTKK